MMMGFGMIIPVLPFLVESFGAGGRAIGLLIIGVLGNGLSQLLFGLSTSLWMLFAARVLAAFLASAAVPTAMAYVGDSTSGEERTGGMGVISAAMGMGMLLGPGIAGSLATRSLATPFFFASAISGIVLVFVIVALPESLPPDARMKGREGLRGPQLRVLWQALFSPIGVPLLLAFLLSFGLTNFETIFGLYALKRFSYGPQRIGLLLTVIGLAATVVQGTLTGPLTRHLGEVAIVRGSLVATAIGFLLMTQARTFTAVLVTACFYAVSQAMLRPATSAIVSTRAAMGQGMAMGLVMAFMSLGRVAGPLWGGFSIELDLYYPFLGGAAVSLVGFVLALIALPSTTSGVTEPAVGPGRKESVSHNYLD
jgi:DHA1 family multidrug resistance protein-like MFS transporter